MKLWQIPYKIYNLKNHLLLFFYDNFLVGCFLGTNNRIEVSHDGGVHWSMGGATQPGPAVFGRFGDLMAVGTTQGVFFSRDEFKTVSRSIAPTIANSFRSLTTHVSQRVVGKELFDLQGRRLPNDAFSTVGRHGASGMIISKLRFETGRRVTSIPSARLKP